MVRRGKIHLFIQRICISHKRHARDNGRVLMVVYELINNNENCKDRSIYEAFTGALAIKKL